MGSWPQYSSICTFRALSSEDKPRELCPQGHRWQMKGGVCDREPCGRPEHKVLLEENGMPVEWSGYSIRSSAGILCLSTPSERAAEGTTKKEI